MVSLLSIAKLSTLLFSATFLLAGTATAMGASTALDARTAFVNNGDFKFDLLGANPTKNDGGEARQMNVKQLPSLQGIGASFALVTLEPCGINIPHVHPRASEILFVIAGDGLRTAFAEENGSERVVVNDLKAGEATFFPQGLIHYQQNLGCEKLTFIAALNSEDPGTVTIPTHLFDLPQEAIAASFNIAPSEVQKLHDGLPQNPALGKEQCMTLCGLKK